MTTTHQIQRMTGPEEFHVETIALQPITIQDPDAALITLSDAAKILHMTKPSISGLMDRGTLSVVRRSKSSRRWLLRGEVDALAALKGLPGTPG